MSIAARPSGPDWCLALIGAARVAEWRSRSTRRCARPTIRYLREREQATAVYLERIAPITLECGERVLALTYVADRLHEQYAGRLDREAMLAYVRAGAGRSGDNPEYVLETHDHLQAMGVRDRDLEWLSAKLRAGQ